MSKLTIESEDRVRHPETVKDKLAHILKETEEVIASGQYRVDTREFAETYLRKIWAASRLRKEHWKPFEDRVGRLCILLHLKYNNLTLLSPIGIGPDEPRPKVGPLIQRWDQSLGLPESKRLSFAPPQIY